MVTPELIYTALITLLLLVAIGVSIPVLKQIVRDGLERHRKRQAGEIERYIEDEEYERTPSTALDEDMEGDTRLTCRHCGATNDLEFAYCRRCAKPL